MNFKYNTQKTKKHAYHLLTLWVSLFCGNLLFADALHAKNDIVENHSPPFRGYMLDKIIADVEDQVVLQSNLDNTISDMKRQKIPLPSNPKCDILTKAIINKVLAGQAKRDSIVVSNEEVENEIDLRIRRFIQLYGSLETLEKVAGRTVFQIKEDFRDAIKEGKLADRMQQKLMEDTRLTPEEVRTYYHSIPKDSLPYYESEIEVGALSIRPKTSSDLDEFARRELERYRQQVLSGKVSFDFIVTSYSQDPSKTENNGIYQVSLQDNFWDPIFLSACFQLKNDEISHPVKSKFGYHIIKMIERRGTEATVQHVLRMSQPSTIEIAATKKKLEEIRQQILAGKLSFAEAVDLYGEDVYAKFSGGMIVGQDGNTLLSYDQIDPATLEIIKTMKKGEISEPSPYTNPRGQASYRIIFLKNRTAPHQESLEYDYHKIAARLLVSKKQNMLDKWAEKKMQEVNLFVDDDYRHCNAIKRWLASTEE